jgi:hypothetical protein
MAMSLARFLPQLRQHPGMYVPGRTYVAVSSFVAGYRWGAADESLRGFQSWLADRVGDRPELGWPTLVLCVLYPASQLPDPRTFSDEQDAEAIETLFDMLEDYFRSLSQST